ncbi:B3 domain-containing transcription factor VRN1-like [Trifolium pratense]|uniref:B3 domain-containing transcription factor VRN1-like n=1 Tax=Trifolium pratense TaxID=57577 RepID=UPI001E6909D1|nr:B3 domain-containing transcription factor VRN1-like [Trifolium pratense]
MSMTCNPRNNDTHPSSIIRFFKIVTPTNLQDGNIRIPNAFTKIHSGNISNPMFLNTPDDKKWEIHLTKEDDNIWIQKGFKEFATHYSLDYGHMVMFQYEKNSHFNVHIFDKTTLEIEYHAYGGNQQHHEQNSPIENFDEQLPCKKARQKSQIWSPQPYKKLRFDTSEDAGTSSKVHNLPKLVQVKEENDDTAVFRNMKHDQEHKNLTSKIEEALNKAKNYKSNNPFFTVVMTYSYVNQYMYVPLDFDQKNLKEEQSEIVLRVLDDERTWIVKYCQRRISTGWKTFASDNNLKVGDVCLFEMINSKAYAFKVLIFRLDEEQHSSPPQVHGDEVNWLETAGITEVESKTIMSNKGSMATQRNSLQASPMSFKNSEAKKEANQFTSTLENPHFTIKLKSNHWDVYKPRIQMSFARKYLCLKGKSIKLRFDEELWTVNLACYPSEPSIKLSDGWSQFVDENKLQAGDVCVFELVNEEDVVFDVHIFRGCN